MYIYNIVYYIIYVYIYNIIYRYHMYMSYICIKRPPVGPLATALNLRPNRPKSGQCYSSLLQSGVYHYQMYATVCFYVFSRIHILFDPSPCFFGYESPALSLIFVTWICVCVSVSDKAFIYSWLHPLKSNMSSAKKTVMVSFRWFPFKMTIKCRLDAQEFRDPRLLIWRFD